MYSSEIVVLSKWDNKSDASLSASGISALVKDSVAYRRSVLGFIKNYRAIAEKLRDFTAMTLKLQFDNASSEARLHHRACPT